MKAVNVQEFLIMKRWMIMVKVKSQLSQLTAYSPGQTTAEVKRKYGLTEVVKLASNENPYGNSPHVRQALSKIDHYAIYPEGAASQIRRAVATHLDVDENQLIFSSGLDELIQIISRALLSEGTNTVVATQTFPQYRHHAVIEGAEVREVPLKDGVFDLQSMAKEVDDETKIVWICNPNNPTGTYVSATQLKQFLQSVPSHVLVVMDEAYYEYVTADDYPETIPLLDKYDNLIVLRTFSKAYGLASLRIGYGVGAASFIQQLEVARLPFNTSSFAQTAALAALKDQSFVENSVHQNAMEMQKYINFCKRHDILYYPSQGNFIFIAIPGKESSDVFQYLLENGFIVRPFPNGLRITIGTKEENQKLMDILENKILITT